MKNKTIKVTDKKDKVIFHVLCFIDTGDAEEKEKAKANLSDFAKFFNVPIDRACKDSDIMTSLKDFTINIQGYNSTIPKLYKSLSI